jgi:chemotaxis protein CheD
MSNEVIIKIADLQVAREPAILTTHGLGSCLAIMLYDPEVKTGGLAHVMLPSPELSRQKIKPAKYPQTAIELMVQQMEAMGCQRMRIRAKLVGGSTMFAGLLLNRKDGGTSIGQRNSQETKRVLSALNIPITAEDIGGDYGRSVEFILSSGTVLIRSFKAGLKEI